MYNDRSLNAEVKTKLYYDVATLTTNIPQLVVQRELPLIVVDMANMAAAVVGCAYASCFIPFLQAVAATATAVKTNNHKQYFKANNPLSGAGFYTYSQSFSH